MNEFKITTSNGFDEEGIFPLRTIRAGGKTVRTPSVARLPGKKRKYETAHSDSKGVSEIYTTAGGDELDAAKHDPDGGKLNQKLEEQFEEADDDELAITFTKYTEASTLGPAHAAYLADLHAAYSDIITVPLMHKLVNNIEDDLSDPNYQSFKESVAAFLHQADDRHPNKPVMGLIPRLGWEFIDDLLEIYEKKNIKAYTFDFERRKITTGTQLGLVQPLMQNIADRGIEEHVLLYAINPSPGVHDQALNMVPASDIAAFGLGFDIIGGIHEPPKMSKEAYEDLEKRRREQDEPQFRLFFRDEWYYDDIPLSELPNAFPEDSTFDVERVAARVMESPTNAKYRLQTVINGEQKALAAAELRNELENGDAYTTVREKDGVTKQVTDAYENTREEFDEERFQTGIGDF